nr:16S rRNA (adenine(1518)-N(6)/adenine(1519)-N(6))-dimethyltransferase RsmA [Parvularcula bermudensis]
MSDLPPVGTVVRSHGLLAKKTLGQHFLLDMNITRKIAALCALSPGEDVIEIGPGPGGLTRALLEAGAALTTIERDDRIVPILSEISAAFPGQLTPLEGDALSVDYRALMPGGGVIASNLPYNISTELLVRWLTLSPRPWRRMVLMFQREVGDRILASPGSKAYGRLSVLSQIAARPTLGFHLPARAFTPPPKVASSVLVFLPPATEPQNVAALERVTAAAFGQRRKMIRKTLAPLYGEKLGPLLDGLGLLPTQRAEELSVETFRALAEAL